MNQCLFEETSTNTVRRTESPSSILLTVHEAFIVYNTCFCGMIGYAIKKDSEIPDVIIRVVENHKREKLHRIHASVQ